VAALALVLLARRDNLAVGAPLIALWFVSPIASWWLSCPIRVRQPRLSEKQRAFLGKLARRTWRYFEVFVTAEEHWLPPDNFQESTQAIASRTSPTNTGPTLLANLA